MVVGSKSKLVLLSFTSTNCLCFVVAVDKKATSYTWSDFRIVQKMLRELTTMLAGKKLQELRQREPETPRYAHGESPEGYEQHNNSIVKPRIYSRPTHICAHTNTHKSEIVVPCSSALYSSVRKELEQTKDIKHEQESRRLIDDACCAKQEAIDLLEKLKQRNKDDLKFYDEHGASVAKKASLVQVKALEKDIRGLEEEVVYILRKRAALAMNSF
jgi:hypothetical protein